MALGKCGMAQDQEHLKTLRKMWLLASESQKMWPEEGQNGKAM